MRMEEVYRLNDTMIMTGIGRYPYVDKPAEYVQSARLTV